ncbi:MAG: sugar transferase [Chitinophagaceae bacterium]|nr:sugar transferase [Chitinophagaceae bacterium]
MIRFFDILFSTVGLILFFPIFIIISICIKIETRGPILYKQDRVGKDGKIFKLYKFRSMFINSDKKGLITVGNNDVRITKVGKFIRRYKLDELPQLINVLIGTMSIVGPRPEVEKYVFKYTDEQKKVLSVKPGITDYASIVYKNENRELSEQKNPEQYYIMHIIPKKIELNNIFIQEPTLINYFKIILLTLKEIIF